MLIYKKKDFFIHYNNSGILCSFLKFLNICCQSQCFIRLEKRADRDLMQFNKGKCKILHWGRNDPRHQYVQRPAQLESSLTEKALGVLVDTQLTMSQHYAPAARKAGVILPGLHEEEPLPAGKGR